MAQQMSAQLLHSVERVQIDLFSNATHVTQGTKCMVEQAALNIHSILQDPEQKGLKTALFKLADALQSAVGTDNSLELVIAKNAIDACTPLVGTSIMGACHFRAKDHLLNSPWRVFLLGGSGRTLTMSLNHVVERRKADLEDSEKRAESIKAIVVHLSWLAPPWYMDAAKEKLLHGDPLDESIATLFRTLRRLHDGLQTQPEKDLLLNEVLSAIVPAYCSPLIADRLLDPEHANDWIDDRMLQAARAVQAAPGPQLYPLTGPIPSASVTRPTKLQASASDAHAGLKRRREDDVHDARTAADPGARHGAEPVASLNAAHENNAEEGERGAKRARIQTRSQTRTERALQPKKIPPQAESSEHAMLSRKTLPYVVTSFRLPARSLVQVPTPLPVAAPVVTRELDPPPIPFAFFARHSESTKGT
ncbi:hypothetical protein [Hydrogenophaga sp.]|uniref:hypothetical protein n=1 Tax=Hydrogenophaga sp. TaxID=1904254 RepID=UPI00272506F3|nr:hypothetical protein [Hydrogenophaga sp.]MDO9437359.1 hypothetical protein [Hydrogenophaga sp.]